MANQLMAAGAALTLCPDARVERGHPTYLKKLAAMAGIDTRSPETLAATLPFSCGDATAGTENEYQVAVFGQPSDVDLAITIRDSVYYKNLRRRTSSGDTHGNIVSALEAYLDRNDEGIWENSWVRFPLRRLNTHADRVFQADLRADRRLPMGPLREDAEQFLVTCGGETFVRIPISYLLKLSLADVIGGEDVHPMVRTSGENALGHFLCDNTSPETYSFSPVTMDSRGRLGQRIAGETSLRFLLCQLLLQYANLHHPGARSRFSNGLGHPLVETDVTVRSEIGRSIQETC